MIGKCRHFIAKVAGNADTGLPAKANYFIALGAKFSSYMLPQKSSCAR
jgi:hypothetical protein